MEITFMNAYITVLVLYLQVHCEVSNYENLYSESDDIIILEKSNFHDNIFNNGTRVNWLVEFYHSQCGHCIAYAPLAKSFATRIKGWSHTVKFAGIDCSNPSNQRICQDHNIIGFPTLRYFLSNATSDDKGHNFPVHQNIINLEKELVNYLVNVSKVPYLQPVMGTRDLAEEEAVVLFDKVGFVAAKALLTLHGKLSTPLYWSQDPAYTKEDISVGSVTNGEVTITKSGETNFVELVNYLGKTFIGSWFVLVTTPPPVVTKKVDPVVPSPAKPGSLNSRVHAVDMYSSLTMGFFGDISLSRNIEGEKMTALKAFIAILRQYFSSPKPMSDSLNYIDVELSSRESILAKEWEALVRKAKFPKVDRLWVGCRGSQPYLRGYPCGLWTLFHGLTVQHYLLYPDAKDSASQAVLLAVRGFVVRFFSCTGCAKNFAREAATIEAEVNSTKSAVLWLWSTHNRVNRRLKGAPAEDPYHPKIQFPGRDLCPDCHVTRRARATNQKVPQWRTDKVFDFLVRFYGPENWVTETSLEDLLGYQRSYSANYMPASNRTLPMWEKESASRFTFLDLSLCVVIPVLSSLLVLVIFVYWCCARRRRRSTRRRQENKDMVV